MRGGGNSLQDTGISGPHGLFATTAKVSGSAALGYKLDGLVKRKTKSGRESQQARENSRIYLPDR
jgi:hypothetical protein